MRFLFFLLVLAGTLALFNPTTDDFQVFVRERATEMVSDRARSVGGGLFGDVAGAAAGRLTGELAARTAQRDNYLVASRYTVDLNGADADGGEWVFLGVAKQFIPLEKPEGL